MPPSVTASPCNGDVPGCTNTVGNICTGPGTGLGQCCQAAPVGSCLNPNAPNSPFYNGVFASGVADCLGDIPYQPLSGHPNYGDQSCCQQFGCTIDPDASNYVGGSANVFPANNANAMAPTHVQGTGGCTGTGCCYDVTAYQCDVNGYVEQTTLTNLDDPSIIDFPQTYPNDPANNVDHPTTGTTGYWIDQTEALNYLSNNLWQGLETGDGCIGGCMQSLDCNYNQYATWDNGTCSGILSNAPVKWACISGSCTAIGPCHPDYSTTQSQSLPACQASCTYTAYTGGGVSSGSGVSSSGSGAASIDGCMDSTASNYNSLATFDSGVTQLNPSGSCEYVIYYTPTSQTVAGCQSLKYLDYGGNAAVQIANYVNAGGTIYTPSPGGGNTAIQNCCNAQNHLKYELVAGSTVGPTAC